MESYIYLFIVLITLALVSVFWLFSRRLSSVDEAFKSLSSLPSLVNRLKDLEDSVAKKDSDLVSEELSKIWDSLNRLEDLLIVGARKNNVEISRTALVRTLVLKWLRDEGYYSVKILNDADELDCEQVEVVVEAVRNGLLHRGQRRRRSID